MGRPYRVDGVYGGWGGGRLQDALWCGWGSEALQEPPGHLHPTAQQPHGGRPQLGELGGLGGLWGLGGIGGGGAAQ